MKLYVMDGWIVYNGNIGQEKFLDFAQWIQEAAEKYEIEMRIVKNNELIITIENGQTVLKGKYENKLPCFVVFADKDIRLAEHLEKLGVPVYNPARSIEICDNKAMTYQALADHNIALPKTIIAPKIFDNMELIDDSHLQYIVKELGFPLVLKEAFGSFGQQVYLIENEAMLLEKMRELKGTPYVLQEFISTSFGRDLRLNVVGEQVVATMKRISHKDFRANVSAGGTMEQHEPTTEEIELVIKATKAVGAKFAGVDLLFGTHGPIVCEVNSNAHIRNIFECTGVNVANYIIDYIVKDLKNEH